MSRDDRLGSTPGPPPSLTSLRPAAQLRAGYRGDRHAHWRRFTAVVVNEPLRTAGLGTAGHRSCSRGAPRWICVAAPLRRSCRGTGTRWYEPTSMPFSPRPAPLWKWGVRIYGLPHPRRSDPSPRLVTSGGPRLFLRPSLVYRRTNSVAATPHPKPTIKRGASRMPVTTT